MFKAWFADDPLPQIVESPDEEQAPPARQRGEQQPVHDMLDGDAAGKDASATDILNRRNFGRQSEAERAMLGRIKRNVGLLPAIKSRTHLPSTRGRRIDVARTAREARRTAGETLRLFRKARPDKPRRLLLLVDVSGSMKAHSETTLRFAQLISRARPKVETFCFGTRLSRVTSTLKHRQPDEALGRLSDLVFDFDGGTRIGASLETFLSVSRYAALVRGAVTLVFSDGLERGEPDVDGARRHASGAAQPPPDLGEPARCRSPLPAADARHGRHLACARRARRWQRPAGAGAIAAHAAGGRKRCAWASPPPLRQAGAERTEAMMTSSMPTITSGGRRMYPGCKGRWCRESSGPTRRLRRDYPIEEFLADIAGSGIEKSVYVQLNWAKNRAVDEVAWVQGVADQHGWPHAVVGYADLLDDSAADVLKRQALYPLMRGIRMQLHWHDNEMYRFAAAPDLMNDRRFRKNLRLVAAQGWSFELQVFASQMADAARLAADNPDIIFVLQHAGMLEDLSPVGRAAWRDGMKRLADEENIVSKLSGLGTFIHRNDPAHISDVALQTVELFGAQRCLFGSNFPIEKLWTSYADLVAAHRTAIASLPAPDQQAILSGTATRVYRL